MPSAKVAPDAEEADQTVNLGRFACDQIERRISSAFTGHDFTNLIAKILAAQGYETHASPAGPDSGIDIVAGRGALGAGALARSRRHPDRASRLHTPGHDVPMAQR